MTTAAHDERLDPFIIKVGLVVALGTIMSILDSTIVAVAIDSLSKSFHVTVSTIQWVTTGYLLALAIVIPVTGWGIHRIGAKNLYLISIALFLGGSILCGLAWSANSLIAFRVLQGLGGGMILPVGQTVVARVAGPQRMGRVMGLIGIPSVLGPILGPVIGGAILSHYSWRLIFFVNVPICIVALIATKRVFPPSERDSNHRFDLLGFLLLSPGLALIVYGLSEVGTTGGFTAASVQVSLVLGLLLCVGFVFHALRAKEPLLDLRLFQSRNFSMASVTIFMIGATLYGTIFLLPLYYQVVRGQSALVAGLMMAPQGIGAGMIMKWSGSYTDRHGPRRLIPIGAAICALGTFAYTQVSGSTSYWILAIALWVRGIGIGMTFSPVAAASYRGLSHHQLPRATTIINIMRQIGASLGVAVFAVVLEQQLKHRFPSSNGSIGAIPKHLPPVLQNSLAGAFSTTFWWSFLTCLLVIIPTLFLKKGKLSDQAEALTAQAEDA